MVHASLHFPERGSDNLSLWSFTVKYSVWIYNQLPRKQLGLTPLEFLTKTKSDHRKLLRFHVWSCPVFALEPKFRNDQNLPKWNHIARMGKYLGSSDEHSSLVANVLNLSSGYISPRFQFVFDDLFETVIHTKDDESVFNDICNDLFELNGGGYSKDDYDDNVNLIYQLSPL